MLDVINSEETANMLYHVQERVRKAITKRLLQEYVSWNGGGFALREGVAANDALYDQEDRYYNNLEPIWGLLVGLAHEHEWHERKRMKANTEPLHQQKRR